MWDEAPNLTFLEIAWTYVWMERSCYIFFPDFFKVNQPTEVLIEQSNNEGVF